MAASRCSWCYKQARAAFRCAHCGAHFCSEWCAQNDAAAMHDYAAPSALVPLAAPTARARESPGAKPKRKTLDSSAAAAAAAAGPGDDEDYTDDDAGGGDAAAMDVDAEEGLFALLPDELVQKIAASAARAEDLRGLVATSQSMRRNIDNLYWLKYGQDIRAHSPDVARGSPADVEDCVPYECQRRDPASGALLGASWYYYYMCVRNRIDDFNRGRTNQAETPPRQMLAWFVGANLLDKTPEWPVANARLAVDIYATPSTPLEQYYPHRRLDTISTLWTHFADLSGLNLPASLGRLTQLTALNTSSSLLAGPIPRELSQLSVLKRLMLGANRLSGPIPRELSRLSALQTLDLSDNQLTGPIPREFGALKELADMNLYGNRLTGPIPPELGELGAKLQSLTLGDNQLSGQIPPELGKLRNLLRLEIEKNQLVGAIPRELGGLHELIRLHLERNSLSGPVPVELAQLRHLRSLHLDGNQLSGPISLEVLVLPHMSKATI